MKSHLAHLAMKNIRKSPKIHFGSVMPKGVLLFSRGSDTSMDKTTCNTVEQTLASCCNAQKCLYMLPVTASLFQKQERLRAPPCVLKKIQSPQYFGPEEAQCGRDSDPPPAPALTVMTSCLPAGGSGAGDSSRRLLAGRLCSPRRPSSLRQSRWGHLHTFTSRDWRPSTQPELAATGQVRRPTGDQ